MKQILIELTTCGYWWTKQTKTRHYPLEDLFQILSDEQSRWIQKTEDENDPRQIIIWSDWNIKKAVDEEEFDSYEDFLKYVDSYHQYGRKRFKEVSAIRIFKDNLEFLEQQWQEIRKHKPKYLIFRQHDNGFVDIIEKDDLTSEDKAIIEREHKIYLNYLKRWNEYIQKHPERRNPVWRSSADDEFESDFTLYDPVDEQGVD